MRFYVTIKRWSHLMLPSNKQISQSLAGKFEITLKRGFGKRVAVEERKRREGSSSTSSLLKSFTAVFFSQIFLSLCC